MTPIPADIDLNALRGEMLKLARVIAPQDLAGKNLYVVWGSEAPEIVGGARVYGLTINCLDLLCKSHIDPWLGRGPGMLLDDATLYEDASESQWGKLKPAQARMSFQKLALDICLHELAHILHRGTDRGAPPRPETLHRAAEIVCHATADDSDPVADTIEHDAQYIRAAIHVTHRANRAGGFFSYESVTHSAVYGRSMAWDYYQALAGEPARLIDRPFAEIIATPAPAEFLDLFDRDAARVRQGFAI